MKTFDELIEREAEKFQEMDNKDKYNMYSSQCYFKAGAKFVASNPTIVESVADLQSKYDELKEKADKLKLALEFLRDRFRSDDCEGPELRAQNATTYITASKALQEYDQARGENE